MRCEALQVLCMRCGDVHASGAWKYHGYSMLLPFQVVCVKMRAELRDVARQHLGCAVLCAVVRAGPEECAVRPSTPACLAPVPTSSSFPLHYQLYSHLAVITCV